MRLFLSLVLIGLCMAFSPAPLAAQGGIGNPAHQPPDVKPRIPVGEQITIPTTGEIDSLIKRLESFVSQWGRTIPDGQLSWAELHAAMVEATSEDLSMEVRTKAKELLTEIFPGFPRSPITSEMIQAKLEELDTNINGALESSEIDGFLDRNLKVKRRAISLVEALISYLEGLIRRLGELDGVLLKILGIDAEEASDLKEILRELLKVLKELLQMLLKPRHVEDELIIGMSYIVTNEGAAE